MCERVCVVKNSSVLRRKIVLICRRRRSSHVSRSCGKVCVVSVLIKRVQAKDGVGVCGEAERDIPREQLFLKLVMLALNMQNNWLYLCCKSYREKRQYNYNPFVVR